MSRKKISKIHCSPQSFSCQCITPSAVLASSPSQCIAAGSCLIMAWGECLTARKTYKQPPSTSVLPCITRYRLYFLCISVSSIPHLFLPLLASLDFMSKVWVLPYVCITVPRMHAPQSQILMCSNSMKPHIGPGLTREMIKWGTTYYCTVNMDEHLIYSHYINMLPFLLSILV